MRTAIMVGVTAALLLAFAPAQTGAQQGVTVEVRDFSFQPRDWTVTVGMPVRWINADDFPHHVVTEDRKTVNSGPIAPGKDFTFAFRQAGRFTYRCAIHPTMLGVITVQAP